MDFPLASAAAVVYAAGTIEREMTSCADCCC